MYVPKLVPRYLSGTLNTWLGLTWLSGWLGKCASGRDGKYWNLGSTVMILESRNQSHRLASAVCV